MTVANIQSLWVSVGADTCTVTTNGSAQPTLTLTANGPINWSVNSNTDCPFIANFTTMTLHNPTGAGVQFDVRILYS